MYPNGYLSEGPEGPGGCEERMRRLEAGGCEDRRTGGCEGWSLKEQNDFSFEVERKVNKMSEIKSVESKELVKVNEALWEFRYETALRLINEGQPINHCCEDVADCMYPIEIIMFHIQSQLERNHHVGQIQIDILCLLLRKGADIHGIELEAMVELAKSLKCSEVDELVQKLTV